MKLVNILARDMKSWPRSSDCNCARQDYDREIRFKNPSFDFYAKDLAEDHGNIGDGPVVTKDEWQAAVDLLKSPTWNGEGLPPVGTFCEYERLTCKLWIRCEVLAHRNNSAVVIDDSYDCELVESRRLRPIRSAEQIAADEREKAVHEMLPLIRGLDRTPVEIAFALYDANYRKQASE